MLLLSLVAGVALQEPLVAVPDEVTRRPPGAVAASRARAGDDDDEDDDDERHAPETAITVTARRLDAARERIDPALGAAAYTISNDAIENRPGGETRTLGAVLLQAPGVARDARGALIVRDAPGGVQYRINGVILPAGIGDLGETLSARLAASTELLTGALPAQYGLAPAGVVNVTTKNGQYLAGGQAELYGGAHATLEPAAEWSTTRGHTGLFVSGSYRRSDLGLPATTASDTPRHDGSRETEGFGYLDHVIDDVSRVAVIGGSVDERQEVPAAPVRGIADSASRYGDIARTSRYGILAYQRAAGALSVQASIFGSDGRRRLRPDIARHVALDGEALTQVDDLRTIGLQSDLAYGVGTRHVVRAGVYAASEQLDRAGLLSTAAGGLSTSHRRARGTVSVFLQDEWTPRPALTVNLGMRADAVGHAEGAVHLQPRASTVWRASEHLVLHAGYARSIAVAPLEDSAAQHAGAQEIERSDLVDAGPHWQAGPLTLGLNGYVRWSRNQFATAYRSDAPIGDAYRFSRARAYGVELAATYAAGPISAWSNIAVARATGRGIGADGGLDPAVVGYVANHRVPLDTDQRVTASAGASVRLDELLFSGDLIAGSGTPRTPPGATPNSARNAGYVTADVAAVYHARLIDGRPTDLRIDVRNVTNRHVALGDGTAIGGGAPGGNEPRGIYAGIEQAF